jgi:predicted lysophospholipase L1 biosynthesis ABC-type transport system permease subunit
LENLNIIEFSDLFWGILIGLGAIFFLSIFISNKQNWWALIPGLVLASISLMIILGNFFPEFEEDWGGSLVLGGIGLSFLIIYLINRQMWWAIIPAGVLLSLAVMLGVSNYLPGVETGGLFLLGLALTFALLALVHTENGRMWWAWIPAGILALVGLGITASAGNLFPYVWPLALIAGGGILIYFTLRRRNR